MNPRPVQQAALAIVPDDDPISGRGWDLAQRALAMVGTPTKEAAITHTDKLHDEWDRRDAPTWIDRL